MPIMTKHNMSKLTAQISISTLTRRFLASISTTRYSIHAESSLSPSPPEAAGTIRPVPQRQVHPHGESASSRPALAQALRESEARLSLDVGTPGEHAGENASSVSGAWARRAGQLLHGDGRHCMRGAAHTAWSAAGPVQRPNLPD